MRLEGNKIIYKRCSRCGKRIQSGVKCNCTNKRYKEYDKSRDRDITAFYNSSVWKRKTKKIKEIYYGIDIYSLFEFNVIEFGEVVHHIEPLKEAYELRLDDDNLILLTEMNHRNIHKLMEDGKGEEIKTKLKKYIQNCEL